jgi:hypothetical protein
MAQIANTALDEAGIRQIAADLARVDPVAPSTSPLRREDARLAAQRGTVVVTTLALSTRSPAPLLPLIRAAHIASLRTLIDSGVTVAIGSDNISDSSLLEAEHVHSLGVFDALALLKRCTEDTPRAITLILHPDCLRARYQSVSWRMLGPSLTSDISRIEPPVSRSGIRCRPRGCTRSVFRFRA